MTSLRYMEPPAFKNCGSVVGLQMQDKQKPHVTPATSKTILSKLNGQPTEDDGRLVLGYFRAWLKAIFQHLRELPRSDSPASPRQLQDDLVNEMDFTQYTKQMFRAEAAGHFDFQKHLQEQHWPSNVEIPNANFARKHSLVVSAPRSYSPYPLLLRTQNIPHSPKLVVKFKPFHLKTHLIFCFCKEIF